MAQLRLPQRISRLEELAYNLWWSWNEPAREIFRALDYQAWRLSGHNPVKQLRDIGPEILARAAADPEFLKLYDSVFAQFDTYLATPQTWFNLTHPRWLSGPVAYFSMEFAIHNSLPMYAGGLGILAGDVCKEASDLGAPMVAVGFMYPQGYFHQALCVDQNVCQQEIYRQLNFEETPIKRNMAPDGKRILATVQLNSNLVCLGVWLVSVGRTKLYLLDTDLEENPPECRELSARLYVADREKRLQQEIVLGVGGVRVLRALNIKPSLWHMNEGHTTFMTLERIREEMSGGANLDEAVKKVRATTVFTTHTPVMAGHDIFPIDLVEKYLASYWRAVGLDRNSFFRLLDGGASPQALNMTELALKMSSQRWAVSQLHGAVTRRMWHRLWPDVTEEQVPIVNVTNGVHLPTWMAPEMAALLTRHFGDEWLDHYDDPEIWEQVVDIPDEALWAVHESLKRKLVGAMRDRGRRRWAEEGVSDRQLLGLCSLFDPDALTIAFARRFTEYKRPTLIFRDIERLKRIVNNPWHPVQIVFAGKSHPADMPSKYLLTQVYKHATGREFGGRISFVEDYDMHVSRYLVHGVDLWLNTPRRLQEACGTSGMKAAMNGVLHFSVRDGWWHEAYNGANGWAIGPEMVNPAPEKEDEADAESFYRLLEDHIVPLYYSRDRKNVPHGWVQMVKESLRSLAPMYCTRRMLKEYTERTYRGATWPSKV